MRMKIVSLCILFAALHVTAADKYEIKIHRPLKAGQSFDWAGKGSTKQAYSISSGGQKVQASEQIIAYAFEGVFKIGEVSPAGEPLRGSAKFAKMTSSRDGGAETELIPAGWEVLFDRSKDPVTFTCAQGELTPAMTAGLLNFLTPAREAADEELFGSKEPRAVGDTWKINSEKVQERLGQEAKGKFSPKNVIGEFKLNGVKTMHGVECLDIGGTMKVPDFPLPLPPMAKLESSSMDFVLTALFPVDVSKYRQEEATTMTAKAAFSMPAPNGQQMDGVVEIVHKSEKTYKAR